MTAQTAVPQNLNGSTNGSSPPSWLTPEYVGPATWANRDHDIPVMITGYAGQQDGINWFYTDAGKGGTPETELVPLVEKSSSNGSGPPSLLNAALAYATKYGWSVFPVHNAIFDDDDNCTGCTCEGWKRQQDHYGPDYKCDGPGKCPRVKWREKSTTDPKQIRKWWGHPWQDGHVPNIGIDCGKSGLLVLDYDNYKEHFDGDDLLSFDETETPTGLSGGGGEHLFYLQPEGERFGNATGDLPDGIDIRGHGGYVVVAPSLHKSSNCYQWEEGYGPRDIPLKPLPKKIYDILKGAQSATGAAAVTFSDRDLDKPDLSKWKLSGRVTEMVYDGHNSGDRSATDQSVITALVGCGATDDEILAVFSHYPIGTQGKFAASGEQYLARSIGKARGYVGDVVATTAPVDEPAPEPEPEICLEDLLIALESLEEPTAEDVQRWAIDNIDNAAFLPESDQMLLKIEIGNHKGIKGFLDREWLPAVKKRAKELAAERRAQRAQNRVTIVRGDSWPYMIANDQLVYEYESTEDGEEIIKRKPIARFYAQIVEESIAEDGRATYVMRGKSPHRGEFTTEIDAEGFSDTRRLKATVEAAAGPRDPVFIKMDSHLGPAIKMTSSDDILRTHRFHRTGWNNGKFLIPGREPSGVTLHLPSKLPYSTSGSAELDKGLEALGWLMKTIDSTYAPILAGAIFGPPLAKLAGWENRRYGIFSRGQTGTFKTSITQLFMSIYGAGFIDNDNIIAWGDKATPNAIMKYATGAHDMPFFIDNQKSNTGRGPRAFISTIHAIMEGGEKDRLNRNSEMREAKAINCWPICTGEDLPATDPATIARILVIPFVKRGGAEFPELSKAQTLANHLCAIGDSWITWLESDEGKQAAKAAGEHLEKRQAKWTEHLLAIRPDMANMHRVSMTLAINHLSLSTAALHPIIGNVLKPYLKTHGDGLTAIANTMAGYAAEGLEAHRYLSAVRELLATGRCILIRNKTHSEQMPPSDHDRVIGWKDGDHNAYLFPNTTRAAVERLTGDDLGGMSNTALYAQMDALGWLLLKDEGRQTKQKKLGGTNGRYLHLANVIPPDEPDDGVTA